MFSSGQPKSKLDIIKRFVNERAVKLGISGGDVDSMPTSYIEGLPEGTIVTIVESYFVMKNQGLNDFTIFQNIELHRSSFDDYPNPKPFPSNPNLKNYIYYRLEFELPNDVGFNIGENGFTRDFIEKVVDESLKIYSENF
ncbi:MAG: hypothetical protein QF864_05740 [SAR202 cluster bacterium]|nr:hypothetical protein [SAR202 cluster bacterium]